MMTLIAAVFRVSLSPALTNVATFPPQLCSDISQTGAAVWGKWVLGEIFSCDDVILLYSV